MITLAFTETRQTRFRTSGFKSTSASPIENAAQAINCSTRVNIEGGIVTGSPYGDPVIPRLLAEGPPYGRPTKQCFVVEPVGSNLHPRRQLKMPHKRAIFHHTSRLRVGLCPARLRAIRPSLAQRGTALRASQNAVRFGRTSGFRSTSSSPIENAAETGKHSARKKS